VQYFNVSDSGKGLIANQKIIVVLKYGYRCYFVLTVAVICQKCNIC